MSQFRFYFQSGLEHVLDWNAYDHILFIVVLVAAYTFTNWLRVLWLITIITLGHLTALLLSVYGIVSVSSKWVELLIPITILVTALYNLFTAKKKESQKNISLLYIITTFFGIIQGLASARYFKKIISADSKFLPLLEIELGIMVAHIIVGLVIMVIAFIAQNFFRVTRRDWILVLSSIVIGIILPILRENLKRFF